MAKKKKTASREGEYAGRSKNWRFITLALTPLQYRRLAAMAKRRDQSMTAVVRTMIDRDLPP